MRFFNDKSYYFNGDTFVKKQIIILSLVLLGTSIFSAEDNNKQELQLHRLTLRRQEIINERAAISQKMSSLIAQLYDYVFQ